MARGSPARTELALLLEQGGFGPRRAGLSPDYGLGVMVTQVFEQLRTPSVPREGHPALRDQPDQGEKVPLYGDGLNVRDWLHVDDHCRGILLVLENGRLGEIYNIGGGTELTNRGSSTSYSNCARETSRWSSRRRTARSRSSLLR